MGYFNTIYRVLHSILTLIGETFSLIEGGRWLITICNGAFSADATLFLSLAMDID